MAHEPKLRADAPTAPVRRRFLTGRGRLRGARKAFVILLVFLPLLMIAFKLSGTAIGELLEHASSLAGVGGETGKRVGSVLLVPLAAVIVVFFRVTLGIRVLGPFRSFLLAVAFQATGIPLGLLFLAVVLGVIVAVRRPLKKIRLPYYGRVSVVMSTVAVVIAATLSVSRSFDLHDLRRVAYFPIVALCLTGDAFASTLYREGKRSALWRGAVTAAVAVLITKIAEIHGFVATLVRFPELLILEIGLIILITEYLGYRLFSSLNPPVKKRKKGKKSKRRIAKPAVTDDGIPAVALGLAQAQAETFSAARPRAELARDVQPNPSATSYPGTVPKGSRSHENRRRAESLRSRCDQPLRAEVSRNITAGVRSGRPRRASQRRHMSPRSSKAT